MSNAYHLSVYATAHPDALAEAAEAKAAFSRTENKPWSSAARLLVDAEKSGKTVPIVFSDASADTSTLVYAGVLQKVTVNGKTTKYVATNLRPIEGHTTQELVLESSGEPIAPGYLRSYAIVRTPEFLDSALAAMIPDVTLRLALANALSDSIVEAHAARPDAWGLTPYAMYARLNLGPVEVFILEEQGPRLMVNEERLRAASSRIRKLLEIGESGHYKSVPGVVMVRASGDRFAEVRAHLDLAHVEALRQAAIPRGGYKWKASHSNDLLVEIERLTGRSLPRPSYAQDLATTDGSFAADDDDAEAFARHEGVVVYRKHRARERSGALAAAKKSEVLGRTGRLACQVCDFDFEKVYGELGVGFAECHHAVPLSEYEDDGKETAFADLAIVCANCHRMLHRRRPWLALQGLKQVLAQ